MHKLPNLSFRNPSRILDRDFSVTFLFSRLLEIDSKNSPVMIFRIGGLHYWYVPVINNKNERVIGIYPVFISAGMDNRTSKDYSLSKILDLDFFSRIFDLSAGRKSFDVYRKKFEKPSYSGYIDERMI